MSVNKVAESTFHDEYRVKLTLIRDMLATNPSDPAIHNTHILERQRKLILEKSNINSTINKYLDQIQISAEKGQAEVDKIFANLEQLTGYEFTAEQREEVLAGKLEGLKETFKQLDLKGTTVFFWDKEKNLPCIGDHMIYGYLKGAAEAICRTNEKANGKILQSMSFTQSMINQHVRCVEQFIVASKDIRRDETGAPAYLQRSLRAVTAQGPRITLAKSEVLPEGTEFTFHLRVMKRSPLTEAHLRTILSYAQYFTGLGQWRNAGYGQFACEMESIEARLFDPAMARTQASVHVQNTMQ